ncbi:MAG: NAD(P)H-dependent glycerol-3-phosphate dehydrogenase [Planctomycetota bacterium]
MKQIAVLGTGGWGTAIAHLANLAGNSVRLWGRDPDYITTIQTTRENSRALPGFRIPESIEITADPKRAVEGADLVFVVIPTQFLRRTLAPFKLLLPPSTPVVSGVKGLEIGSLLKPSEIICDILGQRKWGVFSGPSHAEEIVRGLPASLTMASSDEILAKNVSDAMSSASLRVYTDTDALGVELSGALKNVMAIAAGVCDGLRLGDNAKAALVTRALAEMTRYGQRHGAQLVTFYGLAGVGDLITTCYSSHGRNRAVGEKLAKGAALSQILASTTQVAEGVWTVKALKEARPKNEDPAVFTSELPICAEVYRILFENKPPRNSVIDLMTRPKRES